MLVKETDFRRKNSELKNYWLGDYVKSLRFIKYF